MEPTWRGPGKMQFSTWQGLGNKYIVLHDEEIPFELTPERVRRLCDRDFGIGSDGILVIGPRRGPERFGLRIFNPDGSEAEMCGNGVRMVARKLRMEGSITGDRVVLETAAGEIVPVLRRRLHACASTWASPGSAARSSPTSRGDAIGEKLTTAGRTLRLHLRRRRQPARRDPSPWPLELVPLHEVGPVIEEHQYFPRKANVEFVVPVDAHNAKIRVWERGVGETRACGTGATATAVALVRTGVVPEPGDGRAARRQARGRGRGRLARAHDRPGRGDLPRRPVARVPGAPDMTKTFQPQPVAARARACRRTCSPRSSARSPPSGRRASTSSASASATPTRRPRRTWSRPWPRALRDPANHQYPTNRGTAEFRAAVAGYYHTRFGVALDQETRDRAAAGRQGGHRPHLLRAAERGRRLPGGRSRLPGLHDRAADRRRHRRAPAAAPELGFQPDLDAIDPASLARAKHDLRELSQQPDRRRHRRRLLRPPRRLRPRARHRRGARQRLRRHHLRRLRGARASSRRPAPARSASSCSRCRRATT